MLVGVRAKFRALSGERDRLPRTVPDQVSIDSLTGHEEEIGKTLAGPIQTLGWAVSHGGIGKPYREAWPDDGSAR